MGVTSEGGRISHHSVIIQPYFCCTHYPSTVRADSFFNMCFLQPKLVKGSETGLWEATAIQIRETDEGCAIAQKDSRSPALLPQSFCLDFLMWLVPRDDSVYYYLFYFSRQGLLKVPLAPSRNSAYCIHCLSLLSLLFKSFSPFHNCRLSVQADHLLWCSCIFLIDRMSLQASLPRDQV